MKQNMYTARYGGVKTIPYHEELEFQNNFFDECYAKANSQSEEYI